MKKPVPIILFALLLTAAVIIAVILSGKNDDPFSLPDSPVEERTRYVLSPRECFIFFHTDPDVFFDAKMPFYKNCEDFRPKAYKNENGDLVLNLTENQKKALAQAWYSGLDAYKNIANVDVSDDYKTLTVYGERGSIQYALDNKIDPYTLEDMALHQLFSGVEPKEIAVSIVYKLEPAGEIIYSACWPDEKMIRDLSQLENK